MQANREPQSGLKGGRAVGSRCQGGGARPGSDQLVGPSREGLPRAATPESTYTLTGRLWVGTARPQEAWSHSTKTEPDETVLLMLSEEQRPPTPLKDTEFVRLRASLLPVIFTDIVVHAETGL